MVKVNTSDYLKATDVPKEGLLTEFVDEGSYSDSQFKDNNGNAKQNFNITIRLGEDEKTWTMNKTSQRNIVAAYGDESSAWIGQGVEIHVVKMLVGKDMKDVIIGSPTDATAPAQTSVKWNE